MTDIAVFAARFKRPAGVLALLGAALFAAGVLVGSEPVAGVGFVSAVVFAGFFVFFAGAYRGAPRVYGSLANPADSVEPVARPTTTVERPVR